MTPVRSASDPVLQEASRRVLERHGHAGFTAERVAAEAGISRVTLHRNGIRRADLVDALVTLAAEDMRGSLLPVMSGREPAGERLASALGALCGVSERHRAVLGALYTARDPGRGSNRTSGFDFAEPFERLALDSGIGEQDAGPWAELAVNAVTWTYVHMRASHGWSQRRAREAVVTMVMASATALARSPEAAPARA